MILPKFFISEDVLFVFGAPEGKHAKKLGGSAYILRTVLKKAFIDHPAKVGETYRQHLTMAGRFGFSMIFGGIACLVHGFLPFLFMKTGSRTTHRLNEQMVVHRVRPNHETTE